MASPVLSPSQFSVKKKDPSGQDKWNKPRFSGGSGSKTMHIAHGHVPKPPGEHPHHRKAGKRTRRAR